MIVELPSQPEPLRQTVRVPIHNLHEHLLAFLNSNNPSGFILEEAPELDMSALGDLFVTFSDLPWVTRDRFSACAKQVVKASNRAISHCSALEIVAVILGYKNYFEARNARDKYGCLTNRRVNKSRVLGENLHKGMK